MGRLTGKRALVTGASSGIGREVARRFAREGASVACGGRDLERTKQTVKRITADGGTAFAAVGDCAYDVSKAGLDMLSDHIAVEDVADACVFLCADEARFLTGAKISIDGAYSRV